MGIEPTLAVGWEDGLAAILPLRTVRETFASYGSSSLKTHHSLMGGSITLPARACNCP